MTSSFVIRRYLWFIWSHSRTDLEVESMSSKLRVLTLREPEKRDRGEMRKVEVDREVKRVKREGRK